MENFPGYSTTIISVLTFLNVAAFGFIWKTVIGKLNENTSKLEVYLEKHYECQKELSDRFVGKPDFNQQWSQFIAMRQSDHAMINNRLFNLETQQATLITKIDLFMDDSTKKMERLSSTFIAKESEISKRIDKIADNNRG